MCQVIVKNPKKNEQFIIYNHIFSKKKSTFTINQLLRELRQYGLILSETDVEDVVSSFIRAGLLRQYYSGYVVVSEK